MVDFFVISVHALSVCRKGVTCGTPLAGCRGSDEPLVLVRRNKKVD